MGIAKWIGGFLGFIIAPPMGALVGYVIGSLIDGDGIFAESYDSHAMGSGRNRTYEQQRAQTGQRNSFLFSMLVLASYVIRADGKVMHSEMEHVRKFLRINFGEGAVKQGNEILNRLFEQQKQMGSASYRDIVMQSCRQIAANLSYEQRLQLLAFMADIARADGVVKDEEVTAMREIAQALGLNVQEVDSMLNLEDSSSNLNAAYKVLGISPDSSDDEVRKAYRQLALKHHPDRVATLGEDVRKAAEKKFQEINAAKDLIFKARGI